MYVEATAEETEARLLNGLRKRCPALTDNLSLKESLAALRRGQGVPLGKKIVIILDQFEQWLHAKKDEQNTELVQALRQCDGGRVQCIVMVRDDFWMAATRFMRQLDIRLVEGQNSASVDLFDLDHALKVLAAFGRAFGKLPELGRNKSKDQKEFLHLSVSGLAQEGKVICVRLALFAEMMKGTVWTPITLKEVGGTEGVGLTFLEETFSAATAPPEHRYHQKAARAVLKALLPESGTDIKGHMRSYAELLETSGYGNRPSDFDHLIRILDGEIRLITPTDLEGKEEISNAVLNAGTRYYQLTHDYLVHSLRDWLIRKQKETRRGRAELLLTDRAAVWNARPENRQLPSLLQWFNIRWWTPNKNWTPPQHKMMVKAARYLAVRGVLLASFLVLLALVGGEGFGRLKALVLRDRLLESTTADVPGIIKEMASYRRWITPLLQDAYTRAKEVDDSRKQLHSSLALLPVDVTQIEYLSGRLLRSEPHEVPVICDALAPYKDALTDNLWVVVEKPEKGKESERLRAASALATFDPHNERWGKTSNLVVDDLVQENPVLLGQWSQIFRPIKNGLLPRLSEIFRDYQPEHTAERSLATNLIADYSADQIEVLGDFLMDADEKQFVVIYPKLKEQREKALTLLTGEIDKTLPSELPSTDDSREKLAKRQANAAVALLRLNQPETVWPLLKHSPDPRVRSYLVHRIGPMGADSRIIAKHLTEQSDITIRRALLLCLGEFSEKDFSLDDRNELLPLLKEIYQSDSDPGIHAASDWLMRQWGVILPDLPIGEPALTDEQKLRVAQRNTEIVGIRRNIAATQAEWERQLREQQLKLNSSLSDGLVARYSFDEATGTSSANSVEGQPAGLFAGKSEPEWLPGVVGNAVRLDGNGGHFSFGNDFNPQHTDAFSYGCWYFADLERINSSLIAKMDLEDDYRGFDITTEPDGTIGCHLVHSFPDNFVKITTVERFAAHRWHHVFVSYDGSSSAGGLKIYVDGRSPPLRTIADQLSDTIQTSVPLQIGQRGNSFGFAGLIDDVRIYNRCVSDQDVRLFYESALHTLTHIPDDARTPEQQALLVMECRSQSVPLQRLEAQLAAAQLGDCRWYVNSQAQTMMVIPGPVEFVMGAPATEKHRTTIEAQHKRRIGRTFAVASKAVTLEQYCILTNVKHEIGEKFTQYPDLPVVAVSWYQAAEYCNLLSKAEGIEEEQWCYESGSDGKATNPKAEYLSLTGYRLPTEAEMEYSTRAGTITSRYYGETEELLAHYAWFMRNSEDSTHRVGSKKPNDLGLFDTLGNCYTWCQEPLMIYPQVEEGQVVDDINYQGNVFEKNSHRAARGGWYVGLPSTTRSSFRGSYPASSKLYGSGFRIARTIRVE